MENHKESNENPSVVGESGISDVPDTASAMSKTTTISTIAVQSGKTRIVIALLHCGDWLQLKILEMIPEIATLGVNLTEALELQKAHDEVLRQLQNKQSPVEELLRQADQLIATQKPRAEVYAAMAETLGKAWKDVNFYLELRKQILDLNVQYHQKAQEFFDRRTTLESLCNDTVVPVEVETVKKLLTDIHELRRALLESLMSALQAGNSLIGKLKELGAQGTLDSRPDRIRSSVNRAIAQVQSWMDQLHVKRQVLELTFVKRKTQLEQCLALAVLASDLRELEDTVHERREFLLNANHLGDSFSSAELLKHENRKLLPEAQQLQERALKVTKATEQLVASGCYAGEEASKQAYTILSATSEYLSELQNRDLFLDRVISFFKLAQTAFDKLNEIQVQLTSTDLKSTSPQLAQLHAQLSKIIEDITAEPLREGHAILDQAGRGTSTEGVRRVVEELENKKISLEGLCVAHKEENLRISRALNHFFEKQDELYSWLVNIAEAFLQSHRDMGSDSAMASDFLNLHNQLLTDLQTKGNDINALLLTLPPILEYLGDSQRYDVDKKVEELHERWMKLKSILESRLDLAAIYVKFHAEADIVSKELDNLNTSVQKAPDTISDEDLKSLEEKWESIVPLYQSAKNTGLTFISQSDQASEPYLDIKRACICVESVLERLAERQLVVTRNWQTYQTEVVEKKQVLVLLEQTMVESTKTISWVSKLDSQLYPVLTTDSNNSKEISVYLQHKLDTVLPDIKKAQSEVEQRIKTAEALISKSHTKDEKALNVKNKLQELNQKLNEITTDYQILLQVLVAYFNNLSELDKTTENFNTQFSKAGLPNDASLVESLIKEHEASKQAVLEMFKFTQNECDQIINRITRQEPPVAAEKDIKKLKQMLESRRTSWEHECNARREALEAHRQLCQFDSDLNQINETLDELAHQLATVKGQYGESLTSSKATSSAFDYFEKTIDLLEQRIQTFINTGEQLLANRHVHSPHIEHHVKQLKERWNDFKKQVESTRRLIDLSIQYFQLVDEADAWFKEGGRLLLTIARKSTVVKRPEEAQQLLNEIEIFLKPGEVKQEQRIKKILELASELFGPDKIHEATQVITENKEMLNSFSVITNELNVLRQNLALAEEQREQLLKEQEEANAKLAAAKAEAEAARAAAAAAEEAKRAAEIAAKSLIETTTVQKIEISTTAPSENERIVETLRAPEFATVLSDAVIQEGSKFTFICHVSGNPSPTVTWYKDGISIQSNPDYRTTYESGLCTLTIEETFAEDSARYTCKAVNDVGSAETSGTLSVKEAEPTEQLIPPSFVKLLQPGFAKEGTKFHFECKVEGNPLPTVQWFKNQECIDNSPDYVITYNNGEAILKFEKAALTDKAEYTCKASNEAGTAQSTASLSVTPREPAETPTFTVPLSNVMARAGQKIKLECEVSGLPPPTLSWSHNGRPVKETRELKIQPDGNKTTLIVLEAFPKDAGVYVVTASNIAGEATSACSVSVKGRLPTETSDSELASDMEPIKPSVQVPLTDVTVLESNRVRLDCVIVGQPEPEVIWYHNDRPVKESSDFQLLFQGDRCSLIIHEAFTEDAGEYKVVALNSAGEASSSCVLTVTPVVSSPPTDKPQADVKPVAGSPPKFTKLLSDVLTAEEEKVVLEAIVSGEPQPEIKWLLNNQVIIANERIRTTHGGEGIVKLEIDKILPEDRGVYTVKASNPSGEAKCFAQLIVKSQKIPEVAKPYEEVKIIPSFKEKFSDQSVFENNAIKFECIVTGKPAPKVRWLFNEKPVSGKDFLVSTSGDRHVLSVPEAKPTSDGVITCVAENEAGKAHCSAKLSVLPVSTSLLPQVNREVTKHTESSYTLKREVVVQTASSTSKVVTESSNATEPTIEIHKYSSEDEKHIRQINDNAPDITESHKKEEYHQTGAKTSVVEEKLSTTATLGQEALVKIEKEVIPKSIIKKRPPKFVSPVIGKIVDVGADVVLEGILDGLPTPEVKWLKNGVELKPSDDVTITYSHNKATLELKNVNSASTGKFTCEASNEAGTAVCTSDVVVRKTVFPPVFGRRLQAQVIKKGDRINMEVEVTGTPEPTVTWYKNNIPVSQLGKEYKIKQLGNSHTLVIEKADLSDGGRFMVKATNSGGEAQSIADIAVYEPTPDTMVEVVKTVVFEDVRKHETLTSAAEKTSSTVESSTPSFQKTEFVAPPLTSESFVKSDSQFSQSYSSKTEQSAFSEKRILEDRSAKSFEYKSEQLPSHDLTSTKITEVIHDSRTTPSAFTSKVEENAIDTESGIQTSSISKQSSLQYFVNKLKADEQTESTREIVKTEPIKPEIYKKFEDLSKSSDVKIEKEKVSRSDVQETKKEEDTTLHFEFDLKPEPPPEICYTPKSSEILKKEEVAEKIKIIEEMKDLPQTEVPTGGVKILPSPVKVEKLGESPKTLKQEEKVGGFEKSFSTQQQTTYTEQKEIRSFSSSYKAFESEQKQTPLPQPTFPSSSTETTTVEKSWAISKSPDIERPVSSLSSYSTTEKYVVRPLSAQSEHSEEKSTFTSAQEMEKSWAHKSSETHIEKSWPPAPTQEQKQAPTSWSVHSTLEKQWTPFERKFESQESKYSKYEETPVNIPHYIAKVSHSTSINEDSYSASKDYEYSLSSSEREERIEEKSTKASDIIKSWPPALPKEEIVFKPTFSTQPTPEPLPVRPISVQDITNEVILEPGPPPEIGYAQPPIERRQSYVETIEQDLEKNLEKEPTRVLPGAVRTIPPPKEKSLPPPLPPKREYQLPPPLPAKPVKRDVPKKTVEVKSVPFERFPDLEPFPFAPEQERPKPPKLGPPPVPSKFVKGRFTDSDYESDFESVKIPSKWKPLSDTEETPIYRRVAPPKLQAISRARSTESEPLPPSKFDQPPKIDGPPRPTISFEDSKELRKEATQQTVKQVKHFTKTQRDVRKEPPPALPLKPGSPPIFVQPDRKSKPESPKLKRLAVVDGYMADTDEPFLQQAPKVVRHEYRQEESSIERRETYQSSSSITQTSQQKTLSSKSHPPQKELVATPIVTNVCTESLLQKESQEVKLEPFPFKPEPPRQKRTKAPPPPSPSRFVKGEFRESDYESDYEGRIPPIWKVGDSDTEPAYRPVRPNLTPSGRISQTSGRTPTPPTEFDNPPQIAGPPRPKFEPIEKPKPTIKPVPKPVVFKPKPVSAKPEAPITDIIVATPAVREKPIIIEPGTPPEIGYAPGPQKTQYYRSTTSAPYHNAVQTETSNIMHFNESTEHCHRTVSLQQTTKVIKFGDQSGKAKAPAPPKPKKFIPGEFRESDYESEVEGARIRPKWAPNGSDTEEPRYKKVRAPAALRSSSVPAFKERVLTPMEFDTQPPLMPTDRSTVVSSDYTATSGQDKIQHYSRSRSLDSRTSEQQYKQQFTRSTATKIASQHMDSMTHDFKSKTKKFVNDIISDVNKQTTQKPILKGSDSGDAQVYREESRAAQYGTKHVDPDTGLIYFKYDFGYEFGIILPGESKQGEIPTPKKTIIEPPKRTSDIEMPVYHETTKSATSGAQPPQKKTTFSKNVKWEPTSESEMSEYEGEARRAGQFPGARWDPSSCSPASLSPSIPSTSPAFNNIYRPGASNTRSFDTPPSCPSTPGTQGFLGNVQTKRPPMFITPLRDIAAVSGQTARFECIVQSETPPTVLWSKNGRIIEDSNDYQLFYRNGVCRLTIPQAYPDDAGIYTCTATNAAGAAGTSATLQVPAKTTDC